MNDTTVLTLYVTPETAMRCTTNLLAALVGAPPRPTNLEIIYVNEQQRAEDQAALEVPCLKVQRNGQSSFVIGDLADDKEVRHALSV